MGQYPEILRRFKHETAEHEMTVLHDDGLYRHLAFRCTDKKKYSGYYWFDLITVPGALIFQGDGDGFIFQRVEDMFQFFRGPVGRINPAYWQEKVVSGREGLLTYSETAFRDKVVEEFREACAFGVPRGTGRALREQIFDDYSEIHYEQGAREVAELFEHDGFEFSDVDDWDLKDFNWWLLWACHAIVWGIAYYDTKTRPTVPDPAPAKPRPKVRPEPRVIAGSPLESRRPAMVGARRIVDVHLPEPDREVTV